MEEQLNKEAKEGWRFAARITDERAGSEDRKHTSGGVLMAVDSNLGAVVGEKGVHPRKRRKNCPGMGKCAGRDANVCNILLVHGGTVPKE